MLVILGIISFILFIAAIANTMVSISKDECVSDRQDNLALTASLWSAMIAVIIIGYMLGSAVPLINILILVFGVYQITRDLHMTKEQFNQAAKRALTRRIHDARAALRNALNFCKAA